MKAGRERSLWCSFLLGIVLRAQFGFNMAVDDDLVKFITRSFLFFSLHSFSVIVYLSYQLLIENRTVSPAKTQSKIAENKIDTKIVKAALIVIILHLLNDLPC